jgi:thioesterase domain-containing protein
MLQTLERETAFGAEWLQGAMRDEIPLARHIGIEVESADDECVALSAPLAPNTNHRGTAFGGSLYSLAVLTGWAWTTRYLAARQIAADAVIQESRISFLAPATGALRASLRAPAPALVEKFRRMLERAGRGRIQLEVDVRVALTVVARFDGSFVASCKE